MHLELSILTLNVWGIPYFSKDRDIRMPAIGQFFAENSQYDIISLQEVWTEFDYQLIRKAAEKNLPFSHYFYSGVFGSGLCVLSKYPITATIFQAWTVNGYVHRVTHGDWFGGKGVGLCKILVNNHLVNFYIAHLHAEYDREHDDYNAHRVVQAFETAKFIQMTRSDSCVQILAGDLNTQPGDLAHRLVTVASGLKDSYNGTEFENAGTNECANNSYTPLAMRENDPNGKRIDFVFYRRGVNHQVKVLEYKLPLSHTIPGQKISFSDHEAVSAKLLIEYRKDSTDSMGTSSSKYDKINEKCYENTLGEGIEVLEQILKRLRSDKNSYFVMAILLIVPLFFIIDVYPPFGMGVVFLVAKMLFSGIIIFFIFMATIWNAIERNGILSTKLSMQIARTAMAHYDNRPLSHDSSFS